MMFNLPPVVIEEIDRGVPLLQVLAAYTAMTAPAWKSVRVAEVDPPGTTMSNEYTSELIVF
jgi:hypothetical protein